jgi:hypothetical protein
MKQITPESSKELINALLKQFEEIRYVAVYSLNQLFTKQRNNEPIETPSSSESDRYEELLVNPTLLKLASQRGNIDCGGLDYILIKYGNFFQLVYEIDEGHISICLDKATDINILPAEIIAYLNS